MLGRYFKVFLKTEFQKLMNYRSSGSCLKATLLGNCEADKA